MRATLNIDDDVLASVQYLARQDAKPVGVVMSELIQRALRGSVIDPTGIDNADHSSPLHRNLASLGLFTFTSPNGIPVTAAMVETLRDVEGV